MADAIALVLHAAEQIKLVDPHFKPWESRFREPLRCFLAQAVLGVPLRRVEYHTLWIGDGATSKYFADECERHLPQLLPWGTELTLYRWSHLPAGDRLHPRYVLTNVAGINFEVGLDERSESETVDVTVMGDELRSLRWRQYDATNSPPQLKDKIVVSTY